VINLDTMADWWKAVDGNWDELIAIIQDYHPAMHESTPRSDMPISAYGAEAACEKARELIRAEAEQETKYPDEQAIEAKDKRDAEKLLRLFNQAWFGVPESMGAWSIPSFDLLCDLCSDFPMGE
jgi:hypothetical protein